MFALLTSIINSMSTVTSYFWRKLAKVTEPQQQAPETQWPLVQHPRSRPPLDRLCQQVAYSLPHPYTESVKHQQTSQQCGPT